MTTGRCVTKLFKLIISSERTFRITAVCSRKFSQEISQQNTNFTCYGRFVPKTYDEYDEQQSLKPQQPLSPKLLRVSIIGEPNAGKSTLTNQLLKWKVCSVSKKVHTTKYNTAAILVENDTQIVFLDTPGLVTPQHGRKHNLEASLVIDPENSLLNADIVCVVVDVTVSRKINAPLLKLLHSNKEKKSVLILNKIDKLKSKSDLLEITKTLTGGIVDGKISFKEETEVQKISLEALLENTANMSQRISKKISSQMKKLDNLGEDTLLKRKGWPLFSRVFIISALQGEGIDHLKEYLLDSAYPSPWLYHDSIVTNQSPIEIAVMTVRGKLLNFLPQEVPYMLKVVVEMWDESDDGLLNIAMSIICPRKSSMKLVIGSRGKMVSRIADAAKQDLANLFRCNVSLKLIIKTAM